MRQRQADPSCFSAPPCLPHPSPLPCKVSYPDYQSVLCGFRANCVAPPDTKKGNTIGITRARANMKLPLLPCWSEQVNVSGPGRRMAGGRRAGRPGAAEQGAHVAQPRAAQMTASGL
jgi:hypothetical protein